jgi:hypothetical protein
MTLVQPIYRTQPPPRRDPDWIVDPKTGQVDNVKHRISF